MTSLTRLGRFIILINICLHNVSSQSTETTPEISEGEEDLVQVLTDSNFVTVVGSTKYIMVEFFSPSCSHCKSFAPQYVEAARLLKEAGSEVKLAKVDATKETSTAGTLDIKRFPSFKFFRNGKPIDYSGARSSEGMVDWINKKISTGITEINQPGELQYISEEEDVFVVAYISKDSDAYTVLKEVNDVIDDVKFFVVSEPDLMAEYHQTAGTIMIMKTFDDKTSYFKETLTKEKLTIFIQREILPLVIEFSQENAFKIFESPIQKHFIFMSDKADKGHKDTLRDLRMIAREHKEEFLVIHCNVGNDQHQDVLDFFGIKMADIPSFMIFELETNNKYRPTTSGPTDVSIRNLRSFLKDYSAGKISKFIKSAPLPSDWDEHAVKVLVGSNYGSVTKDPALDVLVLLYAPWCGQRCKSLEPVWQQLAVAYKDREDLRIAKFDATANDLDNGEEIEDFPTIILYRKSDNQEIEYTGKRDYESLAKFIETGDFEEYEDTVSNFDDDEDYGLQFEDIGNEKENDEEKEEIDEETDVIEEMKEKKHDEL